MDRDIRWLKNGWGMCPLLLRIALLPLVFFGGMRGSAEAADQTTQPYVEAAQNLTTAYARLIKALVEASLSLEPRKNHEAQRTWTQQHMAHVRDLLDESPAVGPLLARTRELVKGHPAFPLVGQAIANALDNLHEALTQVNQSIEADSEAAAMTHARLAVGMLSATIGRPDANSPTTGTLSYAIAVVSLWSMPVIPPYLPNVPNE